MFLKPFGLRGDKNYTF